VYGSGSDVRFRAARVHEMCIGRRIHDSELVAHLEFDLIPVCPQVTAIGNVVARTRFRCNGGWRSARRVSYMIDLVEHELSLAFETRTLIPLLLMVLTTG
jgi:hypothetical protein